MDFAEVGNPSVAKNSEVLVGLVSDTHLLSGSSLPPEIERILTGVDLILHGGDIYGPSVLDRLEHIAPVLAVRGDEDFFTQPGSQIREEYFLNVGGFALWLVHELPLAFLRLLPLVSEAEMLEELSHRCEPMTDIIVFGDTHRHLVKRIGDILIVNPDSPTLPTICLALGRWLFSPSLQAEVECVLFN